jgi:hypothetical protein
MLKSIGVLAALAALGCASAAAAQSWTTNTTAGTTTSKYRNTTTVTRSDGSSTTYHRTVGGSFGSDGSSRGKVDNMTWSTDSKGKTKSCYKSGSTKICS